MTQPTVYIVIGDSAIAFGEAYDNHPGEVLETVDFTEDGKPDWSGAGICDERGAGADGFSALLAALTAAETNARITGYDIVRVPMEAS